MEKLILPKVGEVYQSHYEIREVVAIAEGENRHPDVIFTVPGKNRHYGQWLPLWSDWVKDATVINR